MNHTILEPVGVAVIGLPSELTIEDVGQLKNLLAHHGVLILTGRNADDVDFIGLLRKFGELTFTTGETPVADFPDLNVISNVARVTPPRSTFHVDSSYLRRPPDYTALRAVTIPTGGGETVFTNQFRAFETLPAVIRAELQGRRITHVVTGLDLTEQDETSAEHPVFWRHPISGRTAIYLSTPKRCAAISGMTTARAERMIQFLYEHSTQESNSYRHVWSPGDLVMWDNRCVMHRGDHSAVVGDRVMHRGMVIA